MQGKGKRKGRVHRECESGRVSGRRERKSGRVIGKEKRKCERYQKQGEKKKKKND